MARAGYLTTVRRGGTSTAFTDEPASLVSGKTYQIDDITKRIWDRTVAVTVYDDGVQVDSADIDTIDYLFGKVIFADSYTVTGPVTIDGNYLPTEVVAQANGYDLNQSSTVLDDTDYETAQANGGFRSRQLGMHDVNVTIRRFNDLTKTFADLLANRTPVLIEIRPGGSGDYFRGWFVPESVNASGDIDALETEELSFQLDADKTSDAAYVAFSWGT